MIRHEKNFCTHIRSCCVVSHLAKDAAPLCIELANFRNVVRKKLLYPYTLVLRCIAPCKRCSASLHRTCEFQERCTKKTSVPIYARAALYRTLQKMQRLFA